MAKIDVSRWGEFAIGDLFEVSAPAPRAVKDYLPGDVPFVSTSDFNNGVMDYLSPRNDDDRELGSCITVSPLTGTAFYQSEDFLARGGAGSSISIMRRSSLTEGAGLFVCAVIHAASRRFSYTDHLSKSKLRSLVVMLPVTSEGEPDWDLMESHIANLKDPVIERADAYRAAWDAVTRHSGQLQTEVEQQTRG